MLVYEEFGIKLLYIISGVMLIGLVYLMIQVEKLKKQINERSEN